MTIERLSHADLSDDRLLNEVRRLAEREPQAIAGRSPPSPSRCAMIASGAGLLVVVCLLHRALRLSEHAAYGRIEAARASRLYPALLKTLGTAILDADCSACLLLT